LNVCLPSCQANKEEGVQGRGFFAKQTATNTASPVPLRSTQIFLRFPAENFGRGRERCVQLLIGHQYSRRPGGK